VLVEAALILPVLLLLLFGAIEFGLAVNDYQSIRQGVREGARNAVVADYGSSTSCGINGSASGAASDMKQVICTTKEQAGLGDDLRVKVTYVPGTGNDGDYGRVKVCATRPAQSVTGIIAPFLSSVDLQSEIVMRAEKTLSLSATPAAETDPSGDNWSWCEAP
jgi:Flp pilus assembly protein TadG